MNRGVDVVPGIHVEICLIVSWSFVFEGIVPAFPRADRPNHDRCVPLFVTA